MDRAHQAGKLIKPEILQQPSLGQVLQTTLDVYTLIKNFHQELQKCIPYHSFHYHNIQTQHGLDIGQTSAYQANYHFRHNTPIHRANDGMRIFGMHGAGIQVERNRGGQEQDEVANDHHIGIDTPSGEHRAGGYK